MNDVVLQRPLRECALFAGKAPAFQFNSRLPDEFVFGDGLGPPMGPGVYVVCARNNLEDGGAEHVLYI